MREHSSTTADTQRHSAGGKAFFTAMRELNPDCKLISESGEEVLFTVAVHNEVGSGEVRIRALMRGSECVVEYIRSTPEGKGLASLALAQFEHVARKLGYTRIIADTAMTGATHMWKRNGYDYVGAATDMMKRIKE
jgi:GNAT superfamily N-acetyltransferase